MTSRSNPFQAEARVLARYLRHAVEELEAAAQRVREMGCTCTPEQSRRYGLVRACRGDQYARRYEAEARRIRRRTATQEPTR